MHLKAPKLHHLKKSRKIHLLTITFRANANNIKNIYFYSLVIFDTRRSVHDERAHLMWCFA